MRKAFLGIALIAASFAGGAAANGPGLSWAQSLLGELRAPGSAEDDAAVAAAEIAAAEGFPEAPPKTFSEPDVVVPPEDSAAVTAAMSPTPTPTPSPTQAQSTVMAPPVPEAPPATAAAAAAPPEVPAPPAPVSAPIPKLNPTPTADAPTPDPAAPAPAPAAWSDAPDSAAPAAAVVPGQSTPTPTPAPAPPVAASAPLADPAVSTAALPAGGPTPTPPPTSTPSAWSETCRRMRELGISKYWVEGEPSGGVRFRCLVPIAGEGAVAQQFEAEGDAVADAAEAALRRVALWRAAAAVSEGS